MSNLAAVVAEEAEFKGRCKGRDLTVLGRFHGQLELLGRLRLGPQSRVSGTVVADAVEIEGDFEGEVHAAKLTFGSGARARGIFLAPRLVIREGASVDGTLNLPQPQKAAPDAGRPSTAPGSQPDAADGETAGAEALDACGGLSTALSEAAAGA